jgi:hypothetical protein
MRYAGTGHSTKQTMMREPMQWFEELGCAVLKQYPEPPRRFNPLLCLKAWLDPVFVFLIVLVIVGTISLPYIVSVYGWTGMRSIRTYSVLAAGIFLWCVLFFAPTLRYILLRYGWYATATVTKVIARSKESLAPPFLGECVYHLDPDQTRETRIYSSWAYDLEPGSVIEALVYPPKRGWFVGFLGVKKPAQSGKRRT